MTLHLPLVAGYSNARSEIMLITPVRSLTLMTLLAAAQPSETTTMQAIRIHEFGPPQVLKLEDASRPAAPPRAGEMLVRVHAAAVNPIDWKIRAGQAGKPPLPYTPGFARAGERR